MVLRVGLMQKKSEYGQVAHPIKGNKVYNNMLANILPLYAPMIQGVKRSFFLSESSHVA